MPRYPNAAEVERKYLRVIRVCYEYTFLRGRVDNGLRLSEPEVTRLVELRQLVEDTRLMGRRDYRRLHIVLPAMLKASHLIYRAVLLNVSGGGMFVACDVKPPIGSVVHIRIGRPEAVEYTFFCRVVRCDGNGVALAFHGVPLEVRYGSTTRRPQRRHAPHA